MHKLWKASQPHHTQELETLTDFDHMHLLQGNSASAMEMG